MKLVNGNGLHYLHHIPLFDVFTTEEKSLLAEQFESVDVFHGANDNRPS